MISVNKRFVLIWIHGMLCVNTSNKCQTPFFRSAGKKLCVQRIASNNNHSSRTKKKKTNGNQFHLNSTCGPKCATTHSDNRNRMQNRMEWITPIWLDTRKQLKQKSVNVLFAEPNGQTSEKSDAICFESLLVIVEMYPYKRAHTHKRQSREFDYGVSTVAALISVACICARSPTCRSIACSVCNCFVMI